MSVWEAGRVWREAPWKGAALCVLLSAAFESDDEGVCFLKVKTLARDARISKRAVRTILPKLAKAGDLTCTAKSSGEHIASRYLLGVKYLHPSAHKGVNCVPSRGADFSAPLFRVNKPMGKPPLTPPQAGGPVEIPPPKPETAAAESAAPCRFCDNTGIFEAQDGRLKGFCDCPAGRALQAASQPAPVESVPLVPPRRKQRAGV